MALYSVVAKICLDLSRLQSLAIILGDIWVNYSGKRGRRERWEGEKKKQSPLGQALYAHSHHPPLALLACLQLSRIIGKASGGGSSYTKDYFYQWNFWTVYRSFIHDFIQWPVFFFLFCFFLTKQWIIPSLKNSVGLSSVSKCLDDTNRNSNIKNKQYHLNF